MVLVLPEPTALNLTDVPSYPVNHPLPSDQTFLLRIIWGYLALEPTPMSSVESIQPEAVNLLTVVSGFLLPVLARFETLVAKLVLLTLRERPTLASRFETVPPPSVAW